MLVAGRIQNPVYVLVLGAVIWAIVGMPSSSWALHWVVLVVSASAMSRRNQARWTRLALFITAGINVNLRIIMFTKPSVSKALGMEPPGAPLLYPAGIHPLPAAIAGPLMAIGVGLFHTPPPSCHRLDPFILIAACMNSQVASKDCGWLTPHRG